MRTIGKRTWVAWAASAASIAVFGIAAERDARACGGCFAPPGENVSAVTDHRMVLSISSKQTTLYDQIEYAGAPDTFAWVLPIADSKAAQLGLSADVVFGTLDGYTGTRVLEPPRNCPPQPDSCAARSTNGAAGGSADAGVASAPGADDGVEVNKHEVVGPYVTDYLHSTDPAALSTWLANHNYAIPADVEPVIAAYVNEHYDFIAMKLVPGAGVSAMRPVRVTQPGASLTLPLRMVAAGTGPVVGITLWVLADAKHEPQNFPFFTIKDSEIAWNWATSASTYTTLRQTKEDALNKAGWELESSISISPEIVKSSIRYGGVVFGGGFGGGGGPVGAGGGAPAESDYPAVDGGASDGGDGGAASSSDIREADLETLFAGMQSFNVRVTRLRADLARAALGKDLVLTASADQAAVPNVRNPGQEIGQPLCPVYDQVTCDYIGTMPRDQARAQSGLDALTGNPTGAGSQHESFSCATATKTNAAGDPRMLGASAVAGLVALTAVRARRKRRG